MRTLYDPRPVLENFFTLTPERVLEAVEHSGYRTTGLCYALNSLENRVYEVELEDETRVVAKFYRPSRWSREAILDEHRLLLALQAEEIPVCAPRPFEDGETLHTTDDGIFHTLFPRVGGRSPDELNFEQLRELGRLLGRIHNISASLGLQHRQVISPDTYGTECLEAILARAEMSDGVKQRYEGAVRDLVRLSQPLFEGLHTFVVHGDCHKGNLLYGRDGWFFLDFDDMGTAPPAQDLWLLLPGRPAEHQQHVDALIEGYELFREFDHASLRSIEALRGLRYVRYAAWIARRWDDPAFKRAFPEWGTDRYWDGQVADVYEQLRLLQSHQSMI